MATAMHAMPAIGLVRVSEAAFEILTTPAQQTHATGSANSPAVRVHRRSDRRLLARAPSAALRLRNVLRTPLPAIFERLVTVALSATISPMLANPTASTCSVAVISVSIPTLGEVLRAERQ